MCACRTFTFPLSSNPPLIGLSPITRAFFFLFLSTGISTKAGIVCSHRFFVYTYFDHHNTAIVSCLLSMVKENILGVIFLCNPNLLLCPLFFHCPPPVYLFSLSQQLMRVLYLFIYFSLKHNSKQSP